MCSAGEMCAEGGQEQQNEVVKVLLEVGWPGCVVAEGESHPEPKKV